MSTASDPWGRVADDGTVYVRTADGEREIGSWQAGSPDEALAFFKRKFDSLETEVSLLEQRMSSTDLSAGQAKSTIARLTAAVTDAHAIGDLDGLLKRLEALGGTIEHRREEHKAAREQARDRGARGPGADRRRGRANRGRGHPLEGQRRADAPAAGGVEGRPARRPGRRGRPLEAAVRGQERLRQAPQGLLRHPRRGARGHPGSQGRAGQQGRGAVDLDRLGRRRPPPTAS